MFFGHFDHDAFRVFAWIGEAFQDHGDEALFDIDIRIVVKQVDTSDGDVAGVRHVVDFTDDLLGQDMVVFTHAEIEAFHGLVHAVAFFLTFLFVLTVIRGIHVEVDGILIVVEESVEVECHHAGDELFTRHPLQLFEDDGQVVVDVFAVDVNMFNSIDMIEELFFTDFFTGRDHCPFDGAAHDLFDLFDFMFLAKVHQADADATFVGATGTTAAVHIGLDIVGKVVVDDMGQFLDVDATGGHVGGDEQLQGAFAEVVHDVIAHGLREVAMEGSGVVTILDEAVCDLLGFQFGAAEDDAIDGRGVVDDAFEHRVAVLSGHHVVLVIHVGGT